MPKGHNDTDNFCPICGRKLFLVKRIVFDPDSGVVGRGGYDKFVVLTKLETGIFAKLLEAKGRIVNRPTLENAAYWRRKDCELPASRGALAALICHMRKGLRRIDIEIVAYRDFGWQLIDLKPKDRYSKDVFSLVQRRRNLAA